MADEVKQLIKLMIQHRHDPEYTFWRSLYNETKQNPEITKKKKELFFEKLAAEFASKGRDKPLALFID